MHGSGVNRADEARTTLLIQHCDREDPTADDVHRSRGQEMVLRRADQARHAWSRRRPVRQASHTGSNAG
ncbi:hypothetical protein [Nonomuraea sp. JJY05]|uniref:hypothetical protein n=1 Tax=Nonomuraea sp. JJY05 TaxID=3350255 RepID=UPI00373F0664